MSSRETTPVLFADAPDRTDQALQTFTAIAECTYLNKTLGRSGQKETMTCDCVEQWDDASGTNLACGDDSNCINRVTSVECDNRLCTCGADCQNQRFQKRQYAAVKVIETERKGFGLVARERMREGQFVYEYVGEVIDEPSFRARMAEYDRRRLRHFYFMMLTKDAFIDATEKGLLARFCNHSCAPNAYVDKWVVGDRLRMGIFARRAIAAGEEITFDYNVDRYGAQQQPCYCGAATCLGWIGGKTQTDAALLLPDGLSDALGVSRLQEKAWLKHHKHEKKPEGGSVNEAFVRSLEMAPVAHADAGKVMAALMKLEDALVVAKLVERLYLTQDPKVHTAVVRLHGYKTLSKVLKEHAARDDLVVQLLLVLKRWPTMTRNKIELSQIEATVKHLAETSRNPAILPLAADLVHDWSKLEMAYRIPKNVSRAPEAAPGSLSPLRGRNPRLLLPEPVGVDMSDDSLPEGWQKALDPNTNTVYYYHTGLGVSKWERPVAAVPTGPKAPKAPKAAHKQPKAEKPKPRPQRSFPDDDFTRLQEERLQKQKEQQFHGVQEKQKLLLDLIVQSQKEAEEKKRLEERAKLEKLEQHRERRRKKHAKHAAKAADMPLETLWTKTLARYVPNMIKKHEAEIGHEHIKGCARELVKILAGKEAKKSDAKPPRELDDAKLKKLKDFCNSFMEKFLAKYRAKRAKPQ